MQFFRTSTNDADKDSPVLDYGQFYIQNGLQPSVVLIFKMYVVIQTKAPHHVLNSNLPSQYSNNPDWTALCCNQLNRLYNKKDHKGTRRNVQSCQHTEKPQNCASVSHTSSTTLLPTVLVNTITTTQWSSFTTQK